LAGAEGTPAVWDSAQALDSTGQLSTTLRLPSADGAWTLDAWAFTAAGISHTRHTMRTAAPLGVAWAMPPALVQGDDLTVVATITQRGAAEATSVNVQLRASDERVLDLTSPAEQSFQLAPGETRPASWTLRAGRAGSADLALTVTWGDLGAPGLLITQTQVVRVVPYGVLDEQTHAGIAGGSETINMTLPPDVDPAGARLEVRSAPNIAGVLAAAAEALTPIAPANPVEPVADVAARLRAALIVEALYRQQGRDSADLPDHLTGAAAHDLPYLYRAQDAAGGWGPVPGAPPDSATTLQVLATFRQLGESGTPPDSMTVERGLAWLARAALPPDAPECGMRNAECGIPDSSALYVLSLYDRADRHAVDRLLAAEPRLPPRARAYLARTLAQTGRAAEARLVVERLASSAGKTADPVVLEALLRVDRARGRGPVVVLARDLLAARAGAGWQDAPETAAAIQAMSSYALVVPEPPAGGSYRVVVNGQVIYQAPGGPGDVGGPVALNVPGSRLHTGENSVRFETDGSPLYYSLRVQAITAANERPIPSSRAPNTALGLLRVYEPGPVTRVALTLTVASASGPVHLDEPLAAGLVRLPGLAFQRVEGQPDAPILRDAGALVRSVGPIPSGTGLHIWLDSLAPGRYVLTYQAVTAAPGSYSILPARLTLPGDPAHWVRSGSYSLLLDP
jgi:hypothetical protein